MGLALGRSGDLGDLGDLALGLGGPLLWIPTTRNFLFQWPGAKFSHISCHIKIYNVFSLGCHRMSSTNLAMFSTFESLFKII